MKSYKTVPVVLALFLLSIVPCLSASSGVDPSIEALWRRVDSANKRRLPKTVLSILKTIEKRALQEKRDPDLLNALVQEAIFGSLVQEGEKEALRISLLEESLPRATKGVRPILELLLSRWYGEYVQDRRWDLLSRASTSPEEGPDPSSRGKSIETMDIPEFRARILSLFERVFQAKELLAHRSMKEYGEFFALGTLPLEQHPTLWDFALSEAIRFHSSPENALLHPNETTTLSPSNPAWSEGEQFLGLSFPGDSPLQRSLSLWRELLSFFQSAGYPEAFASADLDRLEFLSDHTPESQERDSLLLERIEGREKRLSPSSPLLAMVAYRKARLLARGNHLKEALESARKGERLPTPSEWKLLCRSLAEELTFPSLSFQGERTLLSRRPQRISLTVKNLARVYARIYRVEKAPFQKDPRLLERELDKAQALSLLKGKPDWEKSLDLPGGDDLFTHTYPLELPPLESGIYRVLLSRRPDFSFSSGNLLSQILFQVTELSMVLTSVGDELGVSLRNGENGRPLDSGKVQLFRRENVAGEWRQSSLEPRPVESDGRLSFSAQEFRNAEALVATSGQESLILLGLPYSYGYGEPRSVERVFFFTDRALYRPGQPIYFKGILLRQENQGPSLIPNRELTLLLRDTNGQELSKMALRSNSFGSFSGVFTAPSGGLTGPLTISAPGFNGIAQVRVEEYKRPKFEVQLEAPKGEFRLGERITVTGSARTLTALPLSHLPVKYTVLRETRRPWSFWGWKPPSPPREICSGETVSDENGLFQVAFPAEPDPQNGENPSLVELFTVVATVVDSTGETRTGSASLPIGFRSLSLRLSSNPWLEVGKEQLLKVEGTSAAELPVPFQGKLTVFSLPPPETAPLPPLSHPYDQPWEGIVQETPSYGTLGEKVLEREVVGEGSLKVVMNLSSGAYKAVLESEDRFHRPIREEYTFLVVDPRSERPPTTTALLLKSQSTSLRVGEELHVLFGSSFPQGCASLEFYQNGKLFKHQWLGLTDRRQELLRLPITPQMRGGFTVLATLVQGGRLLSQSLKIAVPWREKALKVSLKSFRSRMEPGVKETWTLHVEGPDAEKVLSEGVATLYDSSLDLILPHSWPPNFLGLFPQDRTTLTKLFSNSPLSDTNLFTGVRLPETPPLPSPPDWPSYVKEASDRYGFGRGVVGGIEERVALAAAPERMDDRSEATAQESKAVGGKNKVSPPPSSSPPLRTNLQETAFFFPHLLADPNGEIQIPFTTPEALTRWKFLFFAHTPDLKSGSLEAEAVTRKDLMVEPSAPRFLREGDQTLFPVKVTNLSEETFQGKAALNFYGEEGVESQDKAMGNISPVKTITLKPGESQTLQWRIQAPQGLPLTVYRATAQGRSGKRNLGDGEEGWLPLPERKVLVQESLPLWVNGPGSRSFTFESLLNASPSAVTKSFTVQAVSHPAWLTLKALPYLMEYPHECAEQLFHRLYANMVAQRVLTSHPKIRKVLESWRERGVLLSPLEKNPELRGLLLAETPWVLEGRSESENMRRLSLFFEQNRLEREVRSGLDKLSRLQTQTGGFPWFPGGREDPWVTLTILSGWGRLKRLGVPSETLPAEMERKMVGYTDRWVLREYQEYLKGRTQNPKLPLSLSPLTVYALYGRSFFPEEPLAKESAAAYKAFLQTAREDWRHQGSLRLLSYLAVTLIRNNDKTTPSMILASLQERSLFDEERGRYWRNDSPWYLWYDSPLEGQSAAMEAFLEVQGDSPFLDELRRWLIRNRQTNSWQTTTATADAVAALLSGKGMELLESSKPVRIELDGKPLEFQGKEAGTGSLEKNFDPKEVTPGMGKVTMTKDEPGPAWGGLFWSYLEDADRVSQGSPSKLSVKKILLVKGRGSEGWSPLRGELSVGEEVVVRLEITADREMEYIHLQDRRGACFEPEDALSGWRWGGSLGYYLSTRDSATDLFIDHLPKGTHVVEYKVRAFFSGSFTNGPTTVQCMYAPEFSGHTAGERVTVRERP